MQISTRTNDYIIDTLELKHLMQDMNIVFTDSKIVKVIIILILIIVSIHSVPRYSMELIGIFVGYRGILVYMWSTCLILVKLVVYYNCLDIH